MYVGCVHEQHGCGIGHRTMDNFAPVVASQLFGLEYVHSPIITCTNVPPEGETYAWEHVSPWEHHLQFGRGHKSVLHSYTKNHAACIEVWLGKHMPNSRPHPRRIIYPPRTQPLEALEMLREEIPKRMTRPDSTLIFRHSARFGHFHHLSEWSNRGIVPADTYDKVRAWFKQKYWAAAARRWPEGGREGSYFREGEFAIALLARYGGRFKWPTSRKGMYLKSGRMSKYIPPEHYQNLMTQLKDHYPDAHMILFTDGPHDREEIAPIIKMGFEVHVCDDGYPDLFNVFHSFATADITFDGNSGSGTIPTYYGHAVPIQSNLVTLPLPGAIQSDYHTGAIHLGQLDLRVQSMLRRQARK